MDRESTLERFCGGTNPMVAIGEIMSFLVETWMRKKPENYSVPGMCSRRDIWGRHLKLVRGKEWIEVEKLKFDCQKLKIEWFGYVSLLY